MHRTRRRPTAPPFTRGPRSGPFAPPSSARMTATDERAEERAMLARLERRWSSALPGKGDTRVFSTPPFVGPLLDGRAA